MMWKRRDKVSDPERQQRMEQRAQKIADGIAKVQSGWAAWMQCRFERCSRRTKAAIFYTSLLIGIGWSAWTVYAALQGKSSRSGLSVERLDRPLLEKLPDSLKTKK